MGLISELLSEPTKGLVREVRPSQLKMAEGVEAIIRDGGLYCVEGPVGVGKTFAYLTPALHAGKRTVVATPTKSLQDQIMDKDLPMIAKALGKPLRAVVLKGKNNYACQVEADKLHILEGPVADFFQESRYGDVADFSGAELPRLKKANAETCVGWSCRKAARCGFMRLKSELQSADVVVVNHHLLGSDFYYGTGTLTGGHYDVLIVDEAHKFGDGIREAFACEVAEWSARELDRALKDLPLVIPMATLLGLWNRLFDSVDESREMGVLQQLPIFGGDQASKVIEELQKTYELMEFALVQNGYSENGPPEGMDPDFARQLVTLANAKRTVEELRYGITIMQGEVAENILDNTMVYSKKSASDQLGFIAAPVDTAPLVRPTLEGIRSVVLTSATLAVDDSFDYLRPTIGRRPTLEHVLPTVFNYKESQQLYVPRGLMPISDRNSPEYATYIGKLTDECVALLRAARGNAFILCTSESDMTALFTAVTAHCPELDYLLQGRDGDAKVIVRKFHAAPKPVLFGLKTFWEGIDVPGGKLRLVIIPKLPFPQWNRPTVVARRRKFPEKQAWNKVDYVDMMIDVRQMAGRLIRCGTDRGVVAILDSRLHDKKYGAAVINAVHGYNLVSKRELAEQYLRLVSKYFDHRSGYKEKEVTL